jgi:hypothetical protein
VVLPEIAAKLAALSLGTVGTSIFFGSMPATPDEVCCLYEYGGLAPVHQFGSTAIDYETPAVQVVFRGPKPGPGVTTAYTNPRAKAETAYHGLVAVEVATLTGGGQSGFYHTIRAQQAPFMVGRDENERYLIGVNFLAQKEPSA